MNSTTRRPVQRSWTSGSAAAIAATSLLLVVGCAQPSGRTWAQRGPVLERNAHGVALRELSTRSPRTGGDLALGTRGGEAAADDPPTETR